MKLYKLILSITCLLSQQNLLTDPIITFFVRPYPHDEQFAQETADRLQCGKKLAKETISCATNQCLQAGITASYAGFIDVSSLTGQITFPRKHAEPYVYMVITDRIVPVPMLGNTIRHLAFNPGTATALYKIQQNYDTQTNKVFWNTQKIEKPDSNIIPFESIIIIAKPKHIVVPEGITLTQEGPNLILPDIYAKKGVNLIDSTLYMLNLSYLFGLPYTKYKQEDKRYLEQTGD
ncbi:MAG TPA: hypothetical protein PLU71_00705 [Candidatus Dependentiae bacterium]|nr:hypothetical protein [Candidatus Dependentiae bacterium]HRQ62356.1 hypothetical protein [Candidatus Dependentiae bacterium]